MLLSITSGRFKDRSRSVGGVHVYVRLWAEVVVEMSQCMPRSQSSMFCLSYDKCGLRRNQQHVCHGEAKAEKQMTRNSTRAG
jgi:hypothetical protein